MLSRIGNNLFWLGRYVERLEHLVRFTKVHFMTSLDAQMSFDENLMISTIVDYLGLDRMMMTDEQQQSFTDLFPYILSAQTNPMSFFATITYARENARGARDVISSELWEEINKYYHEVESFCQASATEESFFDFSSLVFDHTTNVKGSIEQTHIHDDTWAMMNLGIHLERSIQVARILQLKYIEINNTPLDMKSTVYMNFNIGMLLKSTESFDMSRKYFKKNPSLENALNFLTLNASFPKSIYYNVNKSIRFVKKLNIQEEDYYQSPLYYLSKLNSEIQFIQPEKLAENFDDFIFKTIDVLYGATGAFERKYLSY